MSSCVEVSSSGVEETDMGSIGTSICNHVIQHFFAHSIPGDVREVENFDDLVFGEGIIVTCNASLSTAGVTKPRRSL